MPPTGTSISIPLSLPLTRIDVRIEKLEPHLAPIPGIFDRTHELDIPL
jgi:hypothetical protein